MPPPEPLQKASRAGDKKRKPETPTGADPSQMQIVAVNNYTTPFQLPSDWIVQVRPRGPQSPIQSDSYYYEPGTGRKFRSLVSVRRYLNGEKDPTPRKSPKKPNNCLVPYYNPGSFKSVINGGKVLKPDELKEAQYTKLEDIHSRTVRFKSADTLPEGWIVEEVPRKDGIRKDRYFIDPATGQKFRSILQVQRFLDSQGYKSKGNALTLHDQCTAPQSSRPQKNSSKKAFKDPLTDLMNPPKRINWVYSGDGQDNWSPLVEECVLPNYVMEQWSETFLVGMNNGMEAPCSMVPHLQLTREESNQE